MVRTLISADIFLSLCGNSDTKYFRMAAFTILLSSPMEVNSSLPLETESWYLAIPDLQIFRILNFLWPVLKYLRPDLRRFTIQTMER